MFKRDGFWAKVLTVLLTVAMTLIATPLDGVAEAVNGTSDAAVVQEQESSEKSQDGASSNPQNDNSDVANSSAIKKNSHTNSIDSSSSKADASNSSASSANEESVTDNNSAANAAVSSSTTDNDDTNKNNEAVPAARESSDDVSLDNSESQSTFKAYWTNSADSEISYTNKDYNASDTSTQKDFSCTAKDNSLHKSTMKVYLKLAGDAKTIYKAGTVKIELPAGFYRGLNQDNPILAACDDGGKALDQVSWMIPKAPATDELTDFNYTEETKTIDGKSVTYYVMQNDKDIPGATELDVDVDYRFRPTMLDVVSKTQSDGSDMGLYQMDYPVTCSVNDEKLADQNLSVSVKTKVNDSSFTLKHGSVDDNKGVFYTWQDSWGTKPSDADQYFYIVWYFDYTRGLNSSMPYSFKLNIDKSKSDGGELVGVNKYPTSAYVPNWYWDNWYIYNRGIDKTYKGIEGNLSLINTSIVGISNEPTDKYVSRNYDWSETYVHPDVYSKQGHSEQVYALLFRYPLAKITDAVKQGIDMEKDGLYIDNGITITETWQDGHVVTKSCAPSGDDLNVKTNPNRQFGKKTLDMYRYDVDYSWYEVATTQTLAADGNDIGLGLSTASRSFYLHSYNFDEKVTWDKASNTYKASTGFDLSDGKYYIYSAKPDYRGKAPGIASISDNNPMQLSDEEYSLTYFWIDYDNERDISYKDGLGWQRVSYISEDYSRYKPIEIWVRLARQSDFEKYGEIVRTGSSSYKFTKSSDGSTTAVNDPQYDGVALPENTVQLEVKQSNNGFYESDVEVAYAFVLHPDNAVRARIKKDVDAGIDTAIGGFGSGKQYVEGAQSWSKQDSMGDEWNRVSYEMAPIQSSSYVEISKNTVNDNGTSDERTVPISYTAATQTNADAAYIGDNLINKTTMKNYIFNSGVFYCLLPAGTYVKTDEIGVGELDSSFIWHSVWDGKDPNQGLVPEVEKDVQMIQDWQGSGRTMLKVTVKVPYDKTQWNRFFTKIRLNLILHDSYTNIVDRGGRVSTSVMFVNTSDDNIIFNSNAKDSSYTGKGFDDWKYYESTAQDGWSNKYEAATDQEVIDFGNVRAFQAGFVDRVATDNDPSYQSSGTVFLSDEYTDRLQYTAGASARTDNIVLYDVFSPDQKNAIGNFESVDVSSIDSKVTYDANNSQTTDTCKPVIYYTTQMPTDQTRSLDSGIWTTTAPDDFSTVKAIAIDCRKTDAGNDFVLDKKGTLVAYVKLKATSDSIHADVTETNDAVVSKRTFVGAAPATSDEITAQTTNRSVTLLAADVSIDKTCDPKSGKQDHPAEIGNDANKQLTYTLTITNKATDSSLPNVRDVHVTDQLPDGLSLDDPSVMTVESGSLGIKAGTKIGGQSSVSYQVDGNKLEFDVSKLPSNGTVTITIPVVRKDPVTQTTYYTNTATIDKVGKQENYNMDNEHASSTTYHRTSVTAMPLSGASGFDGLIAAGGAVLVLSALAWIRRRCHNGEA